MYRRRVAGAIERLGVAACTPRKIRPPQTITNLLI
jgi:hypothetical protein